mgnify:CR=1 FL=1
MSDIHKMSLSSLLCQIDSIKDNSASFLPCEGKQDPDKKIWQDDVDACNAATEIIKKLCEENCFSVAEAISYIAQSKKLLPMRSGSGCTRNRCLTRRVMSWTQPSAFRSTIRPGAHSFRAAFWTCTRQGWAQSLRSRLLLWRRCAAAHP